MPGSSWGDDVGFDPRKEDKLERSTFNVSGSKKSSRKVEAEK